MMTSLAHQFSNSHVQCATATLESSGQHRLCAVVLLFFCVLLFSQYRPGPSQLLWQSCLTGLMLGLWALLVIISLQ